MRADTSKDLWKDENSQNRECTAFKDKDSKYRDPKIYAHRYIQIQRSSAFYLYYVSVCVLERKSVSARADISKDFQFFIFTMCPWVYETESVRARREIQRSLDLYLYYIYP